MFICLSGRSTLRRGLLCGLSLLLLACSHTQKPSPATPSPPPNRPAAKPQAKPKLQPPRAPTSPKAANIRLLRPAAGPLIGTFDGNRNKGIDIAGQPGDPVRAAAAGVVVYAGSGLRGYGNLLLIEHSDNLMTAYAHNRSLLVKDGERVSRGQTIAELGSSGTDRAKLHFEVRRNGSAVNPLPYLN